MIESPSVAASEAGYELRFIGLFDRGRGFAFPCDAQGRVDLDRLPERARANYGLARAGVGTALSAPFVLPVR